MPAWCTPMPLRTSVDKVLPKPAVNRKAPMRSAMASLSARLAIRSDISDCARSRASFWVKWTM